VTREALVARLIDAGTDPVDAGSRARLVGQAVDAYGRSFGGAPTWGWFVPGRIEIFGKHTDYAGGRSLLSAVPRGFAVAAGPQDDGLVRVVDARWHDSVAIDPAAEASTPAGWTSYVAVVARRLRRDFPGARWGTDIALASDLPRAAGLSSSSALVVGLAAALVRRAGIEARPEWRTALGSPLDLAGYLGAVENGLAFKAFAGAAGVGTHGGSEDHTAILLCRANEVSAYSYLPVRHRGDAPMPFAWRFVVAHSGIAADKAGAARERYNRASLSAQALLMVWRNEEGGAHPSLAALLDGTSGAARALANLIRSRPRHGAFEAAELERRLAHFVAEDRRVPAALEAFTRADARALGELARASQADADSLLGNQIPETRELARLALEEGALAASSFGGGFGGSVWALAEADEAASFAARWTAAYARRFPAIGAVEWFDCRPAPATLTLWDTDSLTP
jgi:galactokinase